MRSPYVALIRGINVGRAKRVAMADLRALVEDIGGSDVATLLNSGNVVFSATSALGRVAAQRIEAGLAGTIGVPARVAVLDAPTFERMAEDNALRAAATDDARLFAAVLLPGVDRARLEALRHEDWGDEAFALGASAAYLWCPRGALDSPLSARFTRAAGDGATTRNWATITRLRALLADRAR